MTKHCLMSRSALAGVLLTIFGAFGVAQAGPAATPPMGWNPYNAFGLEVTEDKVIAIAETLKRTGLAEAGYRYVNLDEGWWLKRGNDGRIVVRTTSFPSALPEVPGGPTTLRPFVEKLHGMGLKAGIYTDIGRNTCAQAWQPQNPNLPVGTVAEREVGTYGHEKQDMQLFMGEWGFDYIKVDACGIADYQPDKPRVVDGTYRAFLPIMARDAPPSPNDAKVERLYANLKEELDRVRPHADYVLAICTWGEGGVAEWGRKYGEQWRTSADINASWASMLHNFDTATAHPERAGPGHWNDPDMLEIGLGDFDANHLTEARAHMSMWAIISAPLLLGSDVTKWPQSLIDIAGNREVIAVNQDPLGKQGVVVTSGDSTQVVAKLLANGDLAVALVNRSNKPTTISVNRADLSLPEDADLRLRDLWTGKVTQLRSTVRADLPPRATALYRIGR